MLDKQEIEAAPKITLGGRQFPIPRLAIKQARVVVGNLKVLLPVMGGVIAMLDGVDKDDPAAVAKAGQSMFKAFPLDEASFDAACSAVFAAVTRGSPEITRAEFDELEVGIDEILMALPVVMAQSFAFAKKEAKPALALPGEGQAAETKPTETSTGTASSSDSAASSVGPGSTSKAA